jgi:hypothetical protein
MLRWRREKERKEKRTVSLQPAWTSKPRNSVKHKSGSYINNEDCNYCICGLRGKVVRIHTASSGLDY